MQTYILYGIILSIISQNIKTHEAVFDLHDSVPLSFLMTNQDETTETNDCQFSVYSTRILLTSLWSDLDYIVVPNAVDVVRFELLNTLDLPHLQFSILQAKGFTHGILFEMATPEDVSVLLLKYKLLLQKEVPMKFQFQSEKQLNFYEVNYAPLIDVRSGFFGIEKTEGAVY